MREESDGIALLTDPGLASLGVIVAFSERSGGVSRAPYSSLNLAAHVGDDPAGVDENRRRLLRAVGLAGAASRLTTADQVHGVVVAAVDDGLAGAGASAQTDARPPLARTDALWTSIPGVPLMMLFADCVPIVLVAPGRHPAVAVVHAGWRGALAGLPGTAVGAFAGGAGTTPASLFAYVGPHVCPECYQVSSDLVEAFAQRFPSSAAGDRGVDLGAAVTASLVSAGVNDAMIARAGVCTASTTNRFFSYRAEGLTGRHAALTAVLGRI